MWAPKALPVLRVLEGGGGAWGSIFEFCSPGRRSPEVGTAFFHNHVVGEAGHTYVRHFFQQQQAWHGHRNRQSCATNAYQHHEHIVNVSPKVPSLECSGRAAPSRLFQPYFSLTSALLQPYFSLTSAVLQPYFSQNGGHHFATRSIGVLQAYFSLTSALLQPYVLQPCFSLTSALLQPYFSLTSALLQPC